MLQYQSQHLPGAGNMTQQGWRRIAQSSTGGNDTSFTKANMGGGRGRHKSVLPGALGKSVYYSGCWWLHLTSGCHWETTAKGKQWGYVQGWRGHAVWWEEIGRVKGLPFDLLSEKAEAGRSWLSQLPESCVPDPVPCCPVAIDMAGLGHLVSALCTAGCRQLPLGCCLATYLLETCG